MSLWTHTKPPRIQVLSVSDTGRGRRWTDAEKIRIVEESLGDGVTLAAGYQAQGRFTEAQITCQIEMIRLLNEGRDATFVGKTIGSFIGTLMVNTLAASRNPELCLFHINRVTQNSLAVLTGETTAGVEFSQTKITGSRGGRA